MFDSPHHGTNRPLHLSLVCDAVLLGRSEDLYVEKLHALARCPNSAWLKALCPCSWFNVSYGLAEVHASMSELTHLQPLAPQPPPGGNNTNPQFVTSAATLKMNDGGAPLRMRPRKPVDWFTKLQPNPSLPQGAAQ